MIHDLHAQCPICKDSLTISTDDIDKKYLAEAKERVKEFELRHENCGVKKKVT